MLVTVTTPTYNRAGLLPRLYQSLCRQTCADFEWLVVDDGSTDDTGQVVENFMTEGKIAIRYFSKPNGGKHTAVNMAAREARGELLFIADSDDWLPDTAIEKVKQYFSPIRDNKEYAGICGLDSYPDGRVIGNGLSKDMIDASYLEIRDQYQVGGDMKEVYRTSTLREYPFPEIEGETFCSEALIWNRIAEKYKLRYFNDIIYIAEYQSDGITASITKARIKNPVSTMMTYAEWIRYSIPVTRKIRYAINYWRFAFYSKRRVAISSWTLLFAPLGWIMHIMDKRKFLR